MVKIRSSYYDNLKGILTILVVFGHVISPVQNEGKNFFEYIYKALYIFHMPVFVFVSGILTKSEVRIKDLLGKIFFPLIFFQIIYSFEEYFVNKVFFDLKTFLIEPFSILWYLLSLFVWRLLIKIPFSYKSIYTFLFSIMVACFVGAIDRVNLYFSLSRTIVFFPFFYLGYLLNEYKPDELIAYCFRKKYFVFAGGLMSLVTFYYLGFFEYPKKMFWQALPFSALNVSIIQGIVFRLLVFIMAISMLVFTVYSVKNRRSFLTKIGEKSLQVYLFHLLIIRVLFAQGFYHMNIGYEFKFLIYIILSIVIIKICMSAIFGFFIERITNLGMTLANKISF